MYVEWISLFGIIFSHQVFFMRENDEDEAYWELFDKTQCGNLVIFLTLEIYVKTTDLFEEFKFHVKSIGRF